MHVGQLNIGPEGYGLRIDPTTKVIEITSENDAGVFYGVQTLLSLIKTFPEGLPQTDIHDKPRFGYRGMMVDVARHFVPSHELKRLMDIMAMYKLNKLHLHLVDDEGIRLFVPALPELTEVKLRERERERETEADRDRWREGGREGVNMCSFYLMVLSDMCLDNL